MAIQWDNEQIMIDDKKVAAKTQSEVDVYVPQSKSVDEAIDCLVYELCGLSEEEIGIVEDFCPLSVRAEWGANT